ncbi:MAG: serine/threonine-protein kinase [Myxococcota bacterium]
MIETGDVLAQKYRIEHLLGKGGMGYVFAAFHEQLGRRVAVKFMTPQLSRHPEAVTRFLREARSLARITGEHVARVLDVATHEDGTPYMVMEYLSGRDLAVELEDRHALPATEAVSYVLQACEALAEAHSHGIVHRDLKPSNLFLTQRADGSPLIKVLDFGISKAMVDFQGADPNATESLTASQHLLGSPHYMSPEQVRTPRAIDARSDIWALGVILHELICGERPFGGETPMAILASVVSDPARPLSSFYPDVPSELNAVVQRCLEKDPLRRYPSVAALAHALEPFAGPESRPLVGRIEGIVRASKSSSSSPDQPTSPYPMTPQAIPATLESARDSPYGLESRTAPQPRPSSITTEARSRVARFGALAIVIAFGGFMYLVGALRPWASSETPSASASLPANPAGVVTSAAPREPTEKAAPAVTSLGAAQPQELAPAAPAAPAASASSNEPQRRVTAVQRSAKPSVAHAPSAAPSSSSAPPTPPSDPFDQRR